MLADVLLKRKYMMNIAAQLHAHAVFTYRSPCNNPHEALGATLFSKIGIMR